MTEFTDSLFVIILAFVIGATIQYYIIKFAVGAAIDEFNSKKSKSSVQSKNEIERQTKLLELIALGVGEKNRTDAYFKIINQEERKKEFNQKLQEIKDNYSVGNKDREKKIDDLRTEYQDLF